MGSSEALRSDSVYRRWLATSGQRACAKSRYTAPRVPEWGSGCAGRMMRGLGTYEGAVLWVSTVCAWWRKRGGRIMLAKLHERLPETWNRLTATTHLRNAPKLPECWSHVLSESFLHMFALAKWHAQFGALPASCAGHDIAHLKTLNTSTHHAFLLPISAAESQSCE